MILQLGKLFSSRLERKCIKMETSVLEILSKSGDLEILLHFAIVMISIVVFFKITLFVLRQFLKPMKNNDASGRSIIYEGNSNFNRSVVVRNVESERGLGVSDVVMGVIIADAVIDSCSNNDSCLGDDSYSSDY